MKKYSWMSYVSAGIPIVLMILLFAVPNITERTVVKGIFYALFLGAPVSIILSITALFKKSEKNGFAVLGLSASLLLAGSLIYLLLLGFGMGEA
ncbi:hypothetical protein [Rossellomorea aquimaris]|uniref:Uncharacterized protein n=1 Tax=Rossellomorea aquimaris TaxID=189382 RepID=A0A1J6VTQ5_9BACI|nr:hypothetical protein [Rossellomorea aquimaris]OIU68634.1 hypothetical protein BHE18_17070 [Rossellomorea aquimaris]